MIYAITGSSGFIGTALTRRLVAEGNVVVPIKRFQMGSVESLAAFLDSTKVAKVFHLAAYGNHYNQVDHKEILRANVLYTLNLFRAAGERPVVNVSTSSIYLEKQTLYSISKKTGEWLSVLHPNVTTVRPYSVYGVGEADHRLIPTICRCLRDGNRMMLDESATHDWIYIDDCVRGIVDGAPEIGTGYSYSNLQIVQMLESISGKRLQYDKVDGLRSYDNKAWRCVDPLSGCIGIIDGLKKCWDDYTRT